MSFYKVVFMNLEIMTLQNKRNDKHFLKVNAFCQVLLQVLIKLLRKFGNTKSNEISTHSAI